METNNQENQENVQQNEQNQPTTPKVTFQNETAKPNFFKQNSTQITLKLLLIGFLIIGLILPNFLINNLVEERKEYSEDVNSEVSRNWANDQHLSGPFLVIPYNQVVTEEVNNVNVTKIIKQNLIINPNDLNYTGDLTTVNKHRSLYDVILYSTNLKVNGNFKIPELSEMEISPENLLLNEAYISFVIGDAKGVSQAKTIQINGKSFEFKPSSKNISVINNGIQSINYSESVYEAGTVEDSNVTSASNGMHALFPLQNTTDLLNFQFNLELKGSDFLTFSPIAKNTKVNLNSKFPDPIFTGNFSTDATSKVSPQGFSANWTVSEFQRNIPSFIKGTNQINLEASNFGVNISTQVDNYSKTERATKYMILIIVFTFLVVFITELVNKLRVHIFQYTLIGLAIVIFYTLLLSFGEYLSFDISYLIACISTIGLLLLYSFSIFKNNKSSLTLFGSLCGLFIFMYMIIQMEKYSLITGSIGVFLALAITMYATRKIQFYESEK